MDSEPAHAWWREALEQLDVAKLLAESGHRSSAVFHAWMSLELAIKAVRLAPARIDDLDFAVDELKDSTVGDLGGLERVKGHRELLNSLNKPWHPRTAAGIALAEFAELANSLGFDDIYLACRYPDQWPSGTPAEHFTAAHADRAIRAALTFRDAIRARFASR